MYVCMYAKWSDSPARGGVFWSPVHPQVPPRGVCGRRTLTMYVYIDAFGVFASQTNAACNEYVRVNASWRYSNPCHSLHGICLASSSSAIKKCGGKKNC